MTDTPMTSQLMTPLYASAAMRAIMSDRARLQRMLDFEAALARAEAALGVISATGAAAISEVCDATLYDIAALVEAQAPSGIRPPPTSCTGAPPARMSSIPR